jgi:hypothetical protein
VNPHPLPALLTAAAHVLDQVGELPPVMVTCNANETLLPPLTFTPASLGMAQDDQDRVVHTVAAAMGWSARHLAAPGDGWVADGRVDGIEAQVLAAPLRSDTGEPMVRTTNATTAEHAACCAT